MRKIHSSLTQLSEEEPDCIFTERSFGCKHRTDVVIIWLFRKQMQEFQATLWQLKIENHCSLLCSWIGTSLNLPTLHYSLTIRLDLLHTFKFSLKKIQTLIDLLQVTKERREKLVGQSRVINLYLPPFESRSFFLFLSLLCQTLFLALSSEFTFVIFIQGRQKSIVVCSSSVCLLWSGWMQLNCRSPSLWSPETADLPVTCWPLAPGCRKPIQGSTTTYGP